MAANAWPYARLPYAPNKALRGQISLETLLLAAFALSILIIGAMAVNRMHGAQATAFERAMLRDSVELIASYADEICILGAGNSRVAPVSNYEFELAAYGENSKGMAAARGAINYSKKTICPLIIDEGKYRSNAYLWHEKIDGSPYVHISQKPRMP